MMDRCHSPPPAPNTHIHTHTHTHTVVSWFHFRHSLIQPASIFFDKSPNCLVSRQRHSCLLSRQRRSCLLSRRHHTAELIPGKKPRPPLSDPPLFSKWTLFSSWFTSQTLLWSQPCLSIPPDQGWLTSVPRLLVPRTPNNVPCLKSCSSYSLTPTPTLVCSVLSSQASLWQRVTLFKLTGLNRQWIHIDELIVWVWLCQNASLSIWMILTK